MRLKMLSIEEAHLREGFRKYRRRKSVELSPGTARTNKQASATKIYPTEWSIIRKVSKMLRWMQ
jgi:hypothetical protein